MSTPRPEGMVPAGDPRPKKAKVHYAAWRRAAKLDSHNGLLTASRYEKSGDILRVERNSAPAEQLIVTLEAVYILKDGRSTVIHRWDHGPGIYIPF